MPDAPTVLVVDDEPAARFALRRVLEKEPLRVVEAKDGVEALDAVLRETPALVLLDLNMPGLPGLDVLARVRERPDAPPVLILTAHGSERIAVEAMKRGAYDYLAKPYDIDELRLVVRRALETRDLARENARLRRALRVDAGLGELVGESAAMRRVFEVIARVAPLDATVLIEGESGTGKELVARDIHRRSPRAQRPFIALNCAALPEGLVESELFGHERGAFTGAVATRKGKVELAEKGTLFLDEVGEAPPALQAKLLRVLEERRFERVGGAQAIAADVRLIAATNRDLKAGVRAGTFREDLYYRLKVVDVALPPLRARRGDMGLLARHFLEAAAAKYGKALPALAPEALAALAAYPWPGNVRELKHAIEKALILAPTERIDLEALPAEIAAASGAAPGGAAAAEARASQPPPHRPDRSPNRSDIPAGTADQAGPAGADAARAPGPGPEPEPEPEPEPDAGDRCEPEPGREPDASAAPTAAPETAASPFEPPPEGGYAEAKRRAMLRFEVDYLAAALGAHHGNVSATARALGLHRQSLQNKLRELGLDAERFRGST